VSELAFFLWEHKCVFINPEELSVWENLFGVKILLSLTQRRGQYLRFVIISQIHGHDRETFDFNS